MTGADALVKCLQNEKVEYVFGYPGVAIAPFFNSILDTEIKTVLVRQEQNAAHSANGYARTTGKVGVAAVTSGPGATNIITGIATAFADSIPIVVITGQVDSNLVGSDVFQEADISGACESFVKYSYIVRDAKEIPRIMKEAFYIANSGRKGPVLIDIPIDIQKSQIKDFRYPDEVKLRTYRPTVNGNTVQIKKVFARLKDAKRPIICVGGGVHLAHAEEAVRKFAENNRIPVVCTMMGIGVMKTTDPMFFGMVGNNGNSYGNRAMNEADMIIMAGARVADRSISQPDLITENKTLVHIDVDPAEIGKNAGPEIPLVGDIGSVFEVFNQQECDSEYSDWVDRLRAYKKETEDKKLQKLLERVRKASTVTPEEFVIELSQKLKDDAIYVADVGQNQMWSCGNYIMRNGKFFTSGGMGTMGYSIPAALGAKLAAPDKQVVAVIGDGAFQMCLMELATMRQYRVPVKIAVIKNGWLGLVRQYQHFTYNDRFSVTDLSGSPELDKISDAYGMKYLKLSNNSEMDEKLTEFLANDESVLMEVTVDPSEIA
ncbi:biosynthetic-type acetolactate synthase large subunit [Oribacterium sp. WCC10]|uniref:biosynthetic-type acetolactate synthase large subunit n=1 Tax=Oribacterium sp. WCC10 TaxID=1855343 RepID=UPI0008EDB9CB|nr:biosynthetic-type acetolactate synthase large subunit [Oribacterium sp. WCC10]SFG41635.1 acetolactate synthase, large subunit [Oribacterium sp. WCC10]